MSDSEDNFNANYASESDYDSEGYAPAKKGKAPAKPAAAAKKPAAAPKAKATAPAKKTAAAGAAKKGKTKTPLTEIHDNGSDSSSEVDGARQMDVDNDDEANALPQPNRTKTAHEKYQVLDAIQHILKRPDSYVGSLEPTTQKMWVFDSETKKLVYREIQYSPAFLKIFDEILVNAADNKINDPNMDTIKANIDVENNTISVMNNGAGIPIVIHEKEKVYIPQMIFGQLLSGGNFDDSEKRVVGGRNGYGAKLTNIYSTEFTIETADQTTGQIYKQTWTDNMGKCGKPKITKNSRNQEYTKVTFKPDLKRFSMSCIDEDTAALLKKRVYDMTGSVKDIKVWLNDERLKVKGFKGYVEMYLNSATEENADPSAPAPAKPLIIYEQINQRWEIACSLSDGSFQQISFANSIATTKGGTHVNLIAEQIAKNLVDGIGKKNKGATVKTTQIKNQMWIFVNALVENPTFDSQTKETLTLPASKFGGGKVTVSAEFIKKVAKSGIVERVLDWAKFKADQQAKKTDGAKRTRLSGMVKLSDANNAGGKNASKCTLILTEGDSAKNLAMAGLSVVGRDNFGVFPLRGKLLNVREAKHEQIMKNEEIQSIKKILGLQHGKVYTSTDSLRYGSVMIMTDQDYDGSHIKGLIINFLDCFYPSLLKLPNFLVEFVTPIVRVWKKNSTKSTRNFFTVHEFSEWYNQQERPELYEMKYYKGLGTSEDKDGRAYFSNMERHMINFKTVEDEDRKAVDLAFSKKMADARKEWLRELEPGTYLDHDVEEIAVKDFINKELILFSNADNVRSIPSVVDGLKPVQRKVLWTSFKRNVVKEAKVTQLCGVIMELAAYHHGDESLKETIVNLAQDFMGSNNINLMAPLGQYGSRERGGKDHAASRYIGTCLMPLARRIFHPADDALLDYIVEDGKSIEPSWYLPVLPLLLVNGSEGIGTGWSTNIPPYNPVDIANNVKRLIKGEEVVPMTPWYRGFRGKIVKTTDNTYQVSGVAKRLSPTTLEITELPVRKWTEKFKLELEEMITNNNGVKDYKEYHDSLHVHFIITMTEKELDAAEAQGLEDFFKLNSKLSTSNMIAFDFSGKIRKYDSPETILQEFYPKRLAYYQERKDYLANQLETEKDRLSNQARFIQMIVDKQLVIANRKKADIVSELRRLNFRPFPKISQAKKRGEKEPVLDDLEDREALRQEEEETGTSTDFDYLLGMAIWSLTREKIAKLLQQGADKEEELQALLKIPPAIQWEKDLELFLEAWETSHSEWLKEKLEGDGVTKKKPKTLKTRKSIGKGKRKEDADDSADDFKPSAAAAKTKPRDVDQAPRKRIVSNTIVKEDETDVVIGKSKTAAVKPSAAAPVKKPKTISLDDSEDEAESSNTKQKPAKQQNTLKRKPLAPSSDDEHSEVEVVPAKKKQKATATTLDAFLDKPADKKVTKTQKMKPRSPPKPKQVARPVEMMDISDDEDEPGPSKPTAPRARVARAVAPAKKYLEVSSDGGGDDDDSFTMD